jgi:putative Mg2+ transporter-C (MgtC) family protein
MDMNMYYQEIGQITVAFVIGAIIGIEREFRSKPAGFRTMILISVGSCLYTILSKEMGSPGSTDRIASNIVTGIGFIGAGVIFKEGISVNGLTTAALIWVTAALGMAIGYNDYPVVIAVSIIVVITLFVLEPVQRYIDKFHRVKDYRIRLIAGNTVFIRDLEEFLQANGLGYRCMKTFKHDMEPIYLYRINSPDRNYELINHFLLAHSEVKSFEL